MLIRGETITVFNKTKIGVDEFNHPIYEEVSELVDNVVIQPIEDSDIINTSDLRGRKSAYQLHIPKGDTHNWKDVKVSFWGNVYKTYGDPIRYMEHATPLEWNMKVKCEKYE